MAEIRKYKTTDREAVQYVCLATSVGTSAPMKLTRYILAMYCNYYIDNEPENCFVLADDTDRAVGYIICSSDFYKFASGYKNNYLHEIRCTGIWNTIVARGEIAVHSLFKKSYPAHLHIDILPEYQHMGFGTRLTDTLMEHLKSSGCKGLHLICDTGNTDGVNFYKKYGLEQLKRINAKKEDFTIFGRKF